MFFYHDRAYEYDEQKQNWIFPGFHILSYNDETKEMTVLNHTLGIYLIEFYQRMSKDRIEEILRLYDTNIEDKHS